MSKHIHRYQRFLECILYRGLAFLLVCILLFDPQVVVQAHEHYASSSRAMQRVPNHLISLLGHAPAIEFTPNVNHHDRRGHPFAYLYQRDVLSHLPPSFHVAMAVSNRSEPAGPKGELASGIGTPDAWQMARDLSGVTVPPTQLLSNLSFEDGSMDWQESSREHYELINQTIPHTGKYSAYLCGYPHCDDAIAQRALVPTTTHQVTLSYWIYIGRGDSTPGCQDLLQVSLRTATGAPIDTVQTLCNTDANGWMFYTFDVSRALLPYRGQIVQVIFEASGISAQRATFAAIVDDVSLTTLGSAPGVTVQLLKDPSFDQGRSVWQETSSGGYEIISTAIVRTGSGSTHSAYLCGYSHCNDTIFQQVLLPSALQRIILSYWVYLARGDPSTTCQSTFRVLLRTARGSPITTVQRLCNTDANGWIQYAFDLTKVLASYSGQAIQVVFAATGESRPRVTFFAAVDDAALLVTHQ